MAHAGNMSLTAPCDVGHPWLDMASSILVKAVLDWHSYVWAADCRISDVQYVWVIRERGYASPREELVAFFRSDWCRFLLDGFDISYEAMMEQLAKRGFAG